MSKKDYPKLVKITYEECSSFLTLENGTRRRGNDLKYSDGIRMLFRRYLCEGGDHSSTMRNIIFERRVKRDGNKVFAIRDGRVKTVSVQAKR